MGNIVEKFKNKNWIQDKLVEIVGDCLMIGIGFIGAYSIRVFMM